MLTPFLHPLAVGCAVCYRKWMADTSLYERLEVTLPGPWVDHTDRDYAWTVRTLLDFAVGQFNDAVVACQFFEPINYDGLKRGISGEPSAWRDPVRDRLRGICARAYVYALDATCRFVEAVAKQPLNAPAVTATCNVLLQRFRDVAQIRHSLAHVDERSQAIGYGRKKLPGPVLVIGGSFTGDRFGITSGDGRYVEVEVSERFLASFRSALLEAIWSFEWIVIGNIRAQRPKAH
jgi:hypothetical protein